MSEQTVISIDIETNGSVPGPNSMLSLGAVAFDEQGNEVGQWYEKFEELEGSSWDESTRKWWARFPDALAEATSDQKPIAQAMQSFVGWCRGFGKQVVLAANPATFDGMFVNWYAVEFVDPYEKLPWKHRILDIRTYIHAVLGINYHQAHGSASRKATGFTSETPHSHKAVDDARQQGEEFMALLKYQRERN